MGVFVDRVLAPNLTHKARDTTLATEMGHRLDVKHGTTRESAGNANPSKHELSFGIWCRHIEIRAPPPPPANTPVTTYSTIRQRKSAARCIIPSAQPCPATMRWSAT